MKRIVLLFAALLVAGCGESQQSAPAPEAKPDEPIAEVPAQPSPPLAEAKPAEPVAEAAPPEPPTTEAPDISIHQAVFDGNIEAVKQHLAAGTDANAKTGVGETHMQSASQSVHAECVKLYVANGADATEKADG